MNTARRIIMGAAAALGLSACAGWTTGGCTPEVVEACNKALLRTASFDMKCSAERVKLVPLGGKARTGVVGTMGAEGCGQSARYIVLDGFGDTCQWVANTGSSAK